MKYSRFMIVLAAFLCFQQIVTGQSSPKATPSPVAASSDFLGSASNGRYTNGFFDVEVTYPSEWTVIDQETTAAAIEIGTDFVKSKNERSNRALETSMKSEVVLFHLARKPIGNPDNCSFMMVVLKQPHEKVLPSMIAEGTKSLFANSPNLKIVKDTYPDTVGGQKMARLDFEMSAGEKKIKILYYVAVVKGYAFSFSATFSNENDLKDIEQIISTMRFGKPASK